MPISRTAPELLAEQARLRALVAAMRSAGRDFTPAFAEALEQLRAVNRELEAKRIQQ
jgi:hypothetical protein